MANKRTDKKLLLALALGDSASMVPGVALAYGIAQFKFTAIKGQAGALAAYSHTQGIVTLLLIGLIPLLAKLVDRLPGPKRTRLFWPVIGNGLGIVALYSFAQAHAVEDVLLAWVSVVACYSLSGSAFKAAVPELIPSEELSSVSGLIGAVVPLFLTLNLVIVMGLFADSMLSTKLFLIGFLQMSFSVIAIIIISSYKHQQCSRSCDFEQGIGTNKSYRQFALIVTAKVFLNIAISGTSILSLYYVTRFSLQQSEVFSLNAFMSLGVFAILLTGAAAVYLSERYHRPKLLLTCGTLFIAIGLLGYALADAFWVAVISGIFIQLGLGPVSALMMALVNRSLPRRKHYARDIAIADAAHNVGSATIHFSAPAIVAAGAGMMLDDGYSLYFYGLFGSSLLFIIILCFIRDENHL